MLNLPNSRVGPAQTMMGKKGLGQRPGLMARTRQKGVVLMVALIVLVALTLAGIALMRSVDTSTLIAGNLAFQQGATNYGDTGIETAITWLQTNNSGSSLHSNIFSQGYAASRQDPSTGQTWDSFWTTVISPGGQALTLSGNVASAAQLAANTATGNTVSYAIQRLCNAVGDPVSTGVDCAVPQTSTDSAGTSSKGAGFIQIQSSTSIFYRITSRIVGPRNTISYVQAIVSL
jgi:type IV pilus assembly protein PilX